MPHLIEIATPQLSAAINPLGAELTHLRDAEGRELLTDADPAFWTGHAPILFPIVGRLHHDVLRLDGAEYAMRQHGFARHKTFDLIAQEAGRAVFRLVDSEETRAIYPFAFALDIDFSLEGATLTITARIENRGPAVMSTSFGWHPAFAWPLPYGEPREAHRILFDVEEPEALKRLTADGQVGATAVRSPIEGRTLPLRDDLFAKDALIWDAVRSQRVSYGAPHGPHLDIAFPDTPKLGIWTRSGAHYICIEPWHGIADPEGFTGDFRDKPGVFEIESGADWTTALHIELLP